MKFSGKFADSLLTEQLDRVSLSFLVEDLQIRRGGIAPNICFGLAALGLDPLLIGSVGEDFVTPDHRDGQRFGGPIRRVDLLPRR